MTTTMERKRSKQRGTTGTALSVASLRRALATVRAAVPGHTPKPILSNVLLHNGGITATDLELQVSAEIPWTGEPLLLPFARLSAILNSASGEEVAIDRRDASCTVSCGHGTWTLPTEDAAEFPRWEPTDQRLVCRIPADQFCRAVRGVVYATDTDSSRYALGGVLVEYSRSEGEVAFVATDGRRLSHVSVSLGDVQDPDDSQTLVPARAIQAMAAIAANSEGAVQLEITSREVIATIDGTVVTARLLEGKFPRWRDVFPERDAKATVVNAPEMLAATRQAAIVTSEQSKGVTFAFTDEGIHLTARSSEAGESSVTCSHLEFGQAAVVSLDPQYLVDFLRAVDDGEPVEIEAIGKGDAVVLRCGDCRGVIMPLAAE